MIVALRWVWTAALRFGGFVSHSRWIILSLVLAALGVLGVVVPLPPALNVGLALLSLTLVVMEIRTHALKLREIAFVDQATDAYVDVQRTLQANPRFEFVASNVGSYVIDFKASEAIAEGRVVAHLAPTNFRVPHELKDAGIAFRRRRIAEGATYNGHVVGLNTNLGSGRELLGGL